jgi:hypothetical protein
MTMRGNEGQTNDTIPTQREREREQEGAKKKKEWMNLCAAS